MQPQSFNRYEIGRTLEPRQRSMFFQLGNEIDSNRRTAWGFAPNADDCHETAFAILETVNWKSLKAARALLTATKGWH